MKIQHYIALLVIISIVSVISLSAERDVVVNRIEVTGNKTTEKTVILREMSHTVGQQFRPELLAYERNRIYSLGLFNRVEIDHTVNGNEVTIFVDVHERWYVFPVPVFGMKDRDWSKLYYGLGVIHNNFRGRNEKLWGGFALGYDPWLSTMYKNPAVFGSSDLFLETQFIYTNTENRSIIYDDDQRNFTETRYIFDIIFGRRYSLFSTFSVSLGFRSLGNSESIPGHTRSPTGTDNYLFGSLGYQYDTRDIIEYPMYGTMFRASLSKSGFGETDVDHFRTLVDFRRYIPVSNRLSIAGRAYTTIAGGTPLPHYSHVFIGYEEKVRGHFNDIYEGENLFISSIEARFRLLGPKYYEWSSSVVPEFSVLRYGINLALFGDLGTTWYRDEAIHQLKPVKGFGGGIHLLLPYSGVLRLEYAFNEALDGEFIIDLFVMF